MEAWIREDELIQYHQHLQITVHMWNESLMILCGATAVQQWKHGIRKMHESITINTHRLLYMRDTTHS